jgi:hypothetical protein
LCVQNAYGVAYSLYISDENYFYIGGIVYSESMAFLTKFQFNNTSIEEEILELKIMYYRTIPILSIQLRKSDFRFQTTVK